MTEPGRGVIRLQAPWQSERTMQAMSRRGVPLVVSAPSGTGKTTLCRRLIDIVSGVQISISHTTRAPRGQERDGVDYHFVDDSTFDRMVAAGDFLEWANVHGRRYGTSRRAVDSVLERGVDVMFVIDVQGGRQIAEKLPNAVLVFVVPPDMETLERRLRGRGSESPEQIDGRLKVASREIAAATFYPYWIVNRDLDAATNDLLTVLRASRLRATDKSSFARWLVGNVV